MNPCQSLVDRTIVIMPAYNEEAIIDRTIQRIQDCLADIDILVIDDGSIDRTAPIASEMGARVVRLRENVGIGGAVREGYKIAEELDKEFTVQIDADGQHDPCSIAPMIRFLEDNNLDVVIGSRFMKGPIVQMPFLRRAGIRYFSILTSMIIHRRITDCTSGFRLVNSKARRLLIEEYSSDFPDANAIVYLGLRGMKIAEMSIPAIERSTGSSSLAGLRFISYPLKVTVSVFKTWARHKSA